MLAIVLDEKGKVINTKELEYRNDYKKNLGVNYKIYFKTGALTKKIFEMSEEEVSALLEAPQLFRIIEEAVMIEDME